MIYDGDRLDVKEFNVPNDLYFVIVDLAAGKDTKEILSALNRCYPFAENQLQRNVQEYLGPISAKLTNTAYEALRQGDAARIGPIDDRGTSRI